MSGPGPISIQGLAANDPTPGLYVQVNTAAGVSSGSGADRNLVLVGNMLTTGSATADTLVYGPSSSIPLSSEADCIALFGAGSELHCMFRRAAALNQVTSISAIAVTESVGAKASITFTLGGTATAPGTLRIWIRGEPIDVGFITGDAGTVAVGDAAVLAINARTDLPVTASHAGASASLVLTAKQKGLRGNWLRAGAQLLNSVGVTLTGGAFAYLTGGTTADSNATALTTLATMRFYYIASAAEDATQFGAVATQVDTLGQPINGNRQKCFAGSVDTLANAITLATGVNKARAELLWLAQSDIPPCELAACAAAIYALEEASEVPRLNFNGYPLPFNGPLSQVAPTRAQEKSALNNGITPVHVGSTRACTILRRITSYSLNGSVQDYRVRDSGKLTVCDFYGDDLAVILGEIIEGKNICDDPVTPTQPVPANCVCPRDVKAQANKLTRQYADAGLIDKVGLVIANTQAVRETNPTNRIDVLVPIFVVDICNQLGVKIDQVG